MSRVFIHSWHGDFAKTQITREIDYLGRVVSARAPSLKLFACGCGIAHLRRLRRPWWMRMVLTFRLYRCIRCGADVFRRRRERGGYPAI